MCETNESPKYRNKTKHNAWEKAKEKKHKTILHFRNAQESGTS